MGRIKIFLDEDERPLVIQTPNRARVGSLKGLTVLRPARPGLRRGEGEA